MNINQKLFEESQTGLFETMDTIHPLSEILKKEFEYYAVEYCCNILIEYYQSKNAPAKNTEKLFTVIFNAGVMTRYLFDKFADNDEERTNKILNFLNEYRLWEQDGWIENLLMISECEKYNNYLALTISDTLYLTHQNSIVFCDGSMKDMLTILYSVFLFATCANFNFK